MIYTWPSFNVVGFVTLNMLKTEKRDGKQAGAQKQEIIKCHKLL